MAAAQSEVSPRDLVEMVAERLRAAGVPVSLLSRSYGEAYRAAEHMLAALDAVYRPPVGPMRVHLRDFPSDTYL